MSDKQGIIFSICPIQYFVLFGLLNLATLIQHVFMILLIQFLSRQQLLKAGRGSVLTKVAARHNFPTPPSPLQNWCKFRFRPNPQVFSGAAEELRWGGDQGGCNLGHISQQLNLPREITFLVGSVVSFIQGTSEMCCEDKS